MVESVTSERLAQKEKLMVVLREAVEKAHHLEPGALGVILFGSRTHSGPIRPDSDVDLLHVQRQVGIKAAFALQNSIEEGLKSLGWQSDYKGTIYLDWIDRVQKSQTRDGMAEQIYSRCQWIDKDSAFVLVDPEAERKIREFARPEEKEWSRTEAIRQIEGFFQRNGITGPIFRLK